MSQIVYLSYGRGPHELEVVFSLMSALKWRLAADTRLIIYAEHPEVFEGLPVEIRTVSDSRWREWSGPKGFNHRRKIEVLRDAMRSQPARTLLLDGDTWWSSSPEGLFARIAPGRSVMHIREGRLDRMGMPKAEAMGAFLKGRSYRGLDGTCYDFDDSATMWNAGVIGLHPADTVLLDEVLAMTDALCEEGDLHVLEQFAFTAVLGEKTKLQEAASVVFHYWPPYLHDPFRKLLPELMAATRGLPVGERAEACYKFRPRPRLSRRCKVIFKRGMQIAGLIGPGCRTSEW